MSNAMCSRIAAKKETTFGTAATGTFTSTEFNNFGVVPTRDVLIPGTKSGGAPGFSRIISGRYSEAGPVGLDGTPGGLNAIFMEGLMGDVTTTNLGGGAYQHVYSATNMCENVPSYTVYEDALALKTYHVGTEITSLEVTQDTDGFTKYNWAMNAARDYETTAPTMTDVSPQQTVFADAAITVNGVSETRFRDLGITIDVGFERDNTLNGQVYATERGSRSTFDPTVTCTMEFDDPTYYRRFWGSLTAVAPGSSLYYAPLVITWTTPIQIGASGQYYSVQFDFKRAYLTEGAYTIPDSGAILQPMTWKPGQDGSQIVLVVTIVNATSSI